MVRNFSVKSLKIAEIKLLCGLLLSCTNNIDHDVFMDRRSQFLLITERVVDHGRYSLGQNAR